jgi:hypothetical protein
VAKTKGQPAAQPERSGMAIRLENCRSDNIQIKINVLRIHLIDSSAKPLDILASTLRPAPCLAK